MAIAGVALSAGSSLLQFSQQKSAAKVQAFEAETQATAEELGAQQREADRKSRLADALASQNARAGAAGIAAFEGSPLAILEADIEAERVATERDVFQTELRTRALRAGAKIRGKQIKKGAEFGLLGSAGQLAFQAKDLRG